MSSYARKRNAMGIKMNDRQIEIDIEKTLDGMSHPHCDPMTQEQLFGRLVALCDVIGVSKRDAIEDYKKRKSHAVG